MTIDDLVTILSNQVTTLGAAIATATALGDLDQVVALEAKLIETQATLDAVKAISG